MTPKDPFLEGGFSGTNSGGRFAPGRFCSLPICCKNLCCVSRFCTGGMGSCRQQIQVTVQGSMKHNASPGEHSEASRQKWKPGQEQLPGPENQGSQHKLNEPSRFCPGSGFSRFLVIFPVWPFPLSWPVIRTGQGTFPKGSRTQSRPFRRRKGNRTGFGKPLGLPSLNQVNRLLEIVSF